MTFTPDPGKTSHYLPTRQPYVECTINEHKIHARLLGWQGEMILVEYPLTMITKYTQGQLDVMWLHKSLAVRIRREESIWAELEDDYPWHETQDQKISFRPDPWSIYKQEFPDTDY